MRTWILVLTMLSLTSSMVPTANAAQEGRGVGEYTKVMTCSHFAIAGRVVGGAGTPALVMDSKGNPFLEISALLAPSAQSSTYIPAKFISRGALQHGNKALYDAGDYVIVVLETLDGRAVSAMISNGREVSNCVPVNASGR